MDGDKTFKGGVGTQWLKEHHELTRLPMKCIGEPDPIFNMLEWLCTPGRWRSWPASG